MKRKTLFTVGRRGDRVRVLVDETLNRVVVHYRDSKRLPKKKNFDDTKAGRSEAIAWAESYHAERHRLEKEAAAPRKVTLGELGDAFFSSPAFLKQLRPKSQVSYQYRWTRWMNYLTRDHAPDDTTLLDVDTYFTRGEKAGTALNQLRQVVNVARIIYRWGQKRKLVRNNELSLWRFQQPKDAVVNEPAEYTAEEFAKMLALAPATDGRKWRINVMLMLGGHQGMRANALTNLSWPDIDVEEGVIVWPAKFQKNGKEFRQPLTWDAVAALETAWYWREVAGYTGAWILFGGGGNKKLGVPVASSFIRERRKARSGPDDPKGTTSSFARSYRKERTADQDVPVTYQGMYIALRKLEQEAGVEHKPGRAFHGLRKMVAGNVADATQDARLGMEWINDKPNSKYMSAYLKQRSSRLDRAAAAAEGKE
jgi:integrase